VVIHDFTACNSNELTIRRGQTVEVLERPHDKPDWCLVRTTDRSPAAEGLVPCGSLCIAHSRSSMEMEGIFNHKGRTLRGSEESTVEPCLPFAASWSIMPSLYYHCLIVAGVEMRISPIIQSKSSPYLKW
jgi:hypothetical protein